MPEETADKAKKSFFPLIGFAVALLAIAFVAFFYFTSLNPQGFSVLASQQQEQSPTPQAQNIQVASETTEGVENFAKGESDVIDPADFPVREQYFKEIFKPRRETYKLFEKAAVFLGKDIDGVKKYFGLGNEGEIWSELPAPNESFSEIAYLLATGKYFAIGVIGEDYYKQPEMYANFKTGGLRYWTKPDPRYWSPHGYGSYPAKQWDTLSLSGRKEFTGVVFVHTAWGVQTWQGFTLSYNPELSKYFDIEIKPQSFLLGPAWPKFSHNWAQRVVVTGKLKPGTLPGSYKIAINTVPPPRELKEKWELAHHNVYFDASVSPIGPAGNFIEFNIEVTE